MSYQTKTETTPLGNSSKVVGTSTSLKKVVIAVLFGAAGLMYAGSDTAGTAPAVDLTKRGITSHETCPYDFKFKGLGLFLEYSGKEGHEDTFSCFEDVLQEWRNHKGLVQFGKHTTILNGIDKSEEEHIKNLMTMEVPKYPVFDTPINFEIPTNSYGYGNYTSGKGWDYADDIDDDYEMRFMELFLDQSDTATKLVQLFQRNLSSGGGSTPGGLFEPHISIIYANRYDPTCLTKDDPEDLLQVLEQHGCGLTTLSEALQVSSITLYDLDNKTAEEWIKIYEIPLSK